MSNIIGKNDNKSGKTFGHPAASLFLLSLEILDTAPLLLDQLPKDPI